MSLSSGLPFRIRVCFLILAVVAYFGFPLEAPRQTQSRPNIILINVDDLDDFLFENGRAMGVFPNLDRLANEGITFSNCHVTSPLCGPSRASLLTGRYLFGHGVRSHTATHLVSNGYPGGYPHYRETNPSSQVGVVKPDWAQFEFSVFARQAGYRTMFVGKYLHDGYTPAPGQPWQSIRPPGWDDFYASLGGKYYEFPRDLSRCNGRNEEVVAKSERLRLEDYPARYRAALQSRYRTNIEVVDSIRLIQDHASTNSQPFLLYLAPFAPHKPSSGEMLDNRYNQWWSNLKQPWQTDFNLAQVATKPLAIRELPLLDNVKIEQSDAEYRQRMLAMKSFDDMLGLLWQSLEETGIDQNTLILFTSDNGYMLGQQRHFGKQVPYDHATRVPMVAWGPGLGVPSGESRSHLISHVDLMPTILDWCEAPRPVGDGRSFRSLMETDAIPAAETWRPEGVLTEQYQQLGHSFPRLEGVYNSVRFYDQRYTRWGDGTTEFYDLQQDPLELRNDYAQLSSGERHLFDYLLMDFRRPSDPFGGSIATPRFDGEVQFRKSIISGYAEATEGVSQVRLVISRPTPHQWNSMQFFNGQSWQNHFVQVQAELAAPNSSLTRWNYEFFPSGAGEHRIAVTARIYDRSGQVQSNVFRRWLWFKNGNPASAINEPVGPQSTANRSLPLPISGWAKGESALREVRLVIRDLESGLYFDGTQWRSGHRFVLADSYSPTDPTYLLWNYSLPSDGRAKRVVITARAYQMDGSYEENVSVTRVDFM